MVRKTTDTDYQRGRVSSSLLLWTFWLFSSAPPRPHFGSWHRAHRHGGLATGASEPGGFSDDRFRTSLQPCHRKSITCHGLGNEIRPWRSLVDAIRCPALRGYPKLLPVVLFLGVYSDGYE